jgi:2-polyprenyl-6-methoxyphenol hydroxylase-like FAD-dependent oxidoreductase
MTEHSVVLGAGIAGLSAAAALADAGHHVSIIERDRLADNPSPRRGIPQGPHLHSLLSKGWQTLEDLVPGVISDVVAAGAHVLDDARMGARMHIQNGPYSFNRTDPVSDPAALTTYQVTRPQLEYSLRQRISALPNVTITDGHDIGELVAGQPDRITGVTLTDRQTGKTRTVGADLVIDATGRATRTPLLLEQLGYPRPPQRSFTVHGVYHSQQITIPDQDSFPERLILVLPASGAGRGGLVAGENDTWTLTVAAHADEHPTRPKTLVDMLALAEKFVPPHIYPALRRAQPRSDVAVYRYPGGTWHRYHHSDRLPAGLLVIGDALCCLDPIYGQGITMAARQAHILRTHLREHRTIDPQRLNLSMAELIAPVWATNQPPSQDHDPDLNLKDKTRQRAIGWTRRKVLEAAATDIVVTERLIRIGHMIDPPQRLLEPALIARVTAHHLRRAMPFRLRGPRESAHADA